MNNTNIKAAEKMIENIIKKMLRKWLKKQLVATNCLRMQASRERFEWVYNAPLSQWRDRIWVCKQCECTEDFDTLLSYIYS